MTIDNIALFQGLGAKMDYLGHRQRVIAQNVANADTPGYEPKDLKPVDFGRVLDKVTERRNNVHLENTNSGHMIPGQSVRTRADEQDVTYEVAPAGNAVIMEEQLLHANQTVMDYTLMTNVLRKNVSLIQTAIGRQR